MGSNSNETVQRGLGGIQIAGGAVATALGHPEFGVPLMTSGVKSEAAPDPNQGPASSGLQTAGSLQGGPLGQIAQGPLPQMLNSMGQQNKMQSPMMAPPRPPTPPMKAPALPQAPSPPQMPNANPLMALYQKLMGGQAVG
jgi:hypothetical protein